MLVNTAINSLLLEEEFFITGKFEQYNQHEPYGAFVHAFTNLIKQIFTEPKDKIEEDDPQKMKHIVSINLGEQKEKQTLYRSSIKI